MDGASGSGRKFPPSGRGLNAVARDIFGGKKSKKRPIDEEENQDINPFSKKVDDKTTPKKTTIASPVKTEEEEVSEAEKMAALESRGELPPLTEDQLQELANQNGQSNQDNTGATAAAAEEPKGSYVEAAKKKKLDQDLILYIQKGQERREPLPSKIWEIFAKGLMTKIMGMDPELACEIDIEWMDHKLGRGIIACNDSKTTDWVKTLSESFSYEGFTLRAWSRNEFGKRIICQGFLHNKTVWMEKSGPSALAWILKNNKIKDTGRYSVITYAPRKFGVWLRFECDQPLMEAIEAKNCSLKAGCCRLVLEKKEDDDTAEKTNAEPNSGGVTPSTS